MITDELNFDKEIEDFVSKKPQKKKRSNQRYYKYLIEMVGKCQICGSESNLVVHHIKRISQGGEDYPNNIQIVCRKCHSDIHFNEPGMRRK